MNKEYNMEDEETEYIDIEGTVEAIRAAWNIMPDVSLSQMLDTVTTMPFVEMTNEDLKDELNNFVHQNS